MIAAKTSLLKEAVFIPALVALAVLVNSGRADAPISSAVMLAVLTVQGCFHVVMSMHCVRCNPRREHFPGCNAVALVFGLVHVVYFAQRRASGASFSCVVGVCVGLFIMLSHVVYIPLDELLVEGHFRKSMT